MVDPIRLAHVARRQAAKSKIMEETRKASEAKAACLRRGKEGGEAGSAEGTLVVKSKTKWKGEAAAAGEDA